MPIATGTAIAISAALAAGSTAYQVKSSNDARNDAKAQADKQKQEQDALAKQAADRSTEEQLLSQASADRDAAIRRQKALQAGSQGQQGTILTGPLGIPGSGNTGGGKTLLGG